MASSHRFIVAIAGVAAVHVTAALKLSLDHATAEATDLKQRLSKKIMDKFARVDENGDDIVTLAEMRAGFGGEKVGSEMLEQMLSECGHGKLSHGGSCARGDLEAVLAEWAASSSLPRDRTSLLQMVLNGGGFKRVPGHLDKLKGQDCGAAGMSSAEGEVVKCEWQGTACFDEDPLLAWSTDEVCETRGCICEATSSTKRLAKLGLAGALAVGTAANFSDPRDVMSTPACGDGWTAIKVHVDADFSNLTKSEKSDLAISAKMIGNGTDLLKLKSDSTEVALFKTAGHRVSRDGPRQKVCMISWQATRSPGDWAGNMLFPHVPFWWSGNYSIWDGLGRSYSAIKPKLEAMFQKECCTSDFTADKVVISGHSHGGSMAEMNALDAVLNWKCGRDLGAKDLVVALFAPHKGFYDQEINTNVFSCRDPSTCLAGSVAVVSTTHDYVGDPDTETFEGSGLFSPGKGPMHPAKLASIPCPPRPENVTTDDSPHDWCHGIFNYMSPFEEALVDKAGWGSSCDGVCGDVNRQLQCNMMVLKTQLGCNLAPSTWFPADRKPTACPQEAWQSDKEKCGCPVDACWTFTSDGHCHS